MPWISREDVAKANTRRTYRKRAETWISREDVAKAKEMDLLTYLTNYRPGELKKISGGEYGTKTHSSLKISNGKWIWYAGNVGGKTALDYLIKVEGMEFQEAVQEIMGEAISKPPIYIPQEELTPPKEKKELKIPLEGKSFNEMVYYLRDERAIDIDIIYAEYNKENLYQTKAHNNIAFVGRNKEGEIKLITLRGIKGDFKNTADGSDRRYPYMLKAQGINTAVHLFESPIDALSYATLMKGRGIDYTKHNLLALCGVAVAKEDSEDAKLPIPVEQYLDDYPYTDTVCLHLDNDKAGHKESEVLITLLGRRGIKVYDQPPPEGYKDCNDYLKYGEPLLRKAMRGKEQEQTRMDR